MVNELALKKIAWTLLLAMGKELVVIVKMKKYIVGINEIYIFVYKYCFRVMNK